MYSLENKNIETNDIITTKMFGKQWIMSLGSSGKAFLNNPPDFKEISSGVEGLALTPSCESTRITTGCWTIIDRRTLELTREDSPHPKTEERPQWDGGRSAITVGSSPITAGWVTHRLESTCTTEVHPLEWRFWAPHQASQPGGAAMGGGIPKESDFEACWDLIAGLWRDWGRQGLHNAMRLEMNYREKNVKDTNTWRLNYTLLNDQEITEEIKRKSKNT